MVQFQGLLAWFASVVIVLYSAETVVAASDSGFKNWTVLLFAGDSITEQATLPRLNGFISLLAGRYSRSADMIVRGLSGYNIRWYLKHAMPGTEEEIKRGDYNPALITVWLGTNDEVIPTGSSKEKYIPVANYTKTWSTSSRDSRPWHPTPKSCWSLHPTSVMPPERSMLLSKTGSKKGLLDRSNAIAKKYADACAEAAKKAGVPVLDFYSHVRAMAVAERDQLLMDGVHFNAAGHQVVDEKLRATILDEFPTVNKRLYTYQFPKVNRWMKDDS